MQYTLSELEANGSELLSSIVERQIAGFWAVINVFIDAAIETGLPIPNFFIETPDFAGVLRMEDLRNL